MSVGIVLAVQVDSCPVAQLVRGSLPVHHSASCSVKGLCVRCLLKYGIVTTEHLEVHHIEPLIQYWEKRLQNDNLITLCVQCHRFIDMRNNGKLDFEFKRIEEEFNFEFR